MDLLVYDERSQSSRCGTIDQKSCQVSEVNAHGVLVLAAVYHEGLSAPAGILLQIPEKKI